MCRKLARPFIVMKLNRDCTYASPFSQAGQALELDYSPFKFYQLALQDPTAAGLLAYVDRLVVKWYSWNCGLCLCLDRGME